MQFLKEIHIGNDCFIGARSFILPGVTIGNNCIVGAGSVVSGNIPDNSLVVGNPATIICKTTSWAEKKYAEKKFVKGTIKYKKSNT
jgi:galactoside O-acetyltransferase